MENVSVFKENSRQKKQDGSVLWLLLRPVTHVSSNLQILWNYRF